MQWVQKLTLRRHAPHPWGEARTGWHALGIHGGIENSQGVGLGRLLEVFRLPTPVEAAGGLLSDPPRMVVWDGWLGWQLD